MSERIVPLSDQATGPPKIMLILDVGCGKKKQDPSAIGLDRQPGSSADVLCELGLFPWPVRDGCAERIFLSHFLEHQRDILRVMAEVHRVAKVGAEVLIVTPHYSSPDSYTDPTHLYHLGFHSFDYFCIPQYLIAYHRAAAHSHSRF